MQPPSYVGMPFITRTRRFRRHLPSGVTHAVIGKGKESQDQEAVATAGETRPAITSANAKAGQHGGVLHHMLGRWLCRRTDAYVVHRTGAIPGRGQQRLGKAAARWFRRRFEPGVVRERGGGR